MKFLVDQNLPDVLADWLVAQGHEAVHVKALGFSEANDRTIRAHAAATGAIVISKDADFSAPANALRVVWVRIGNTTNRRLIAAWSAAWPAIAAALEQGDSLVEVGP